MSDKKEYSLYDTYYEMSKVIASTLGPQGRFVAVASDGSNLITKDGASVARAMAKVQGMNVYESLCSNFLLDATRSANIKSDGTTTAVVLSAAILKLLRDDTDNIVKNTSNLKKEADLLVKLLRKNTKKDASIFESVVRLAGHPDTSELVMEGLNYSKDISVVRGVVGKKTNLEKIKGSFIETDISGDFSSSFNLKQAGIVLINGDLQFNSEITKILEEAVTKKGISKVVVIARNFSDEIYTYFRTANANSGGALELLPVVAPWVGENKRTSFYQDLFYITGALPINSEDIHEQFGVQNIGKSDVTATTSSLLLNNSNNHPDIQKRLDNLLEELKTVKFAKKRELEERIKLFTGKSSTLTVGGSTFSELEEAYIRTCDSVGSGKAFLENGAVRGGGVELAYQVLSNESKFPLLKQVATAPLGTILQNAKASYEEVAEIFQSIPEKKEGLLSIKDKEISSNVKDVWDATEVVVSSIDTAVSIATTVARVEAVI